MNRLTVKKCVCHKRTFEEIKELSEIENLTTAEELIEAKYCATSCGICRPYIEKMLRTGETAFRPGDYK
jgi:bacterioferritin-associated ferredoxin